MEPYFIVIGAIFQSSLVSAIPVFPNNQVLGLPLQPGFNLPANLALALQSTNNYQPYPPGYNNQFCPCQNQGNNFNGISQIDFNNIFNNPIVKNLLGPNCNQRKNEDKVSRQLQNLPVSSKVPSVVNNYIVIPPEAFKNAESKTDNKKHNDTKQKINSNKKTKTRITKINNDDVRKSSSKKKQNKNNTSSKPKTLIEKEVGVFDKTNRLKTKEVVTTTKPCKSKMTQKTNCKCKKGVAANNTSPKTCNVLDVMKENNCCTENQTARHSVNDYNLMNYRQMFPFFSEFANSQAPNKCCDSQMMYPGFPGFFNNPYLLNYPQILNYAVADNNNKKPDTKTGNQNKTLRKSTPTVILNLKKVNADVNIDVIDENETKKIKPATDISKPKSLRDSETPPKSAKMIKLTTTKEEIKPQTTLMPTASNNKTEIMSTAKPVSEDKIEKFSIPEHNSDDVEILFDIKHGPKDKTENSLREHSSKDDVEILTNPKTFSELKKENLSLGEHSSKKEVENVFDSINTSKGKIGSSTKNYEENLPSLDTKENLKSLSPPELGSEDEVPTLHENYLIEDYYPDFKNDNKHVELSESEEMNIDTNNGHSDLSRERRKLERPVHDYNSFRQGKSPSRNYYKLDRDPALNEIPTTEDPKSMKTYTDVDALTTLSSELNSGEIMYFITPPSLDKIDFQTKQINAQNDGVMKEYEFKISNDKRTLTDSKSSTFSNAKVPYNRNLKLSKLSHDIETVCGNSKVARYGKHSEIEEKSDKSVEEDYSQESSVEKPFIVMAQPVFESDKNKP